MCKFFITFFVLLFSGQAVAEDQAIAKLFAQRGIDGTIVISSLYGGQTFIHNDPRANHRFSPASTFKILNTLISLEERAISGKDDVLKWDGRTYDFPDWNRDQTLESAFKVSCVWCFQELARRVGAEKYRNYLRKSAYGELREPFEETTFWLDGSLEISAIEQVEFLKKVYQRSLPFSTSSYETLRQIMLVEQTPAFTLRAKTGWAARVKPQIGWYVGYVETSKDVWFFATNLAVHDEMDLPLRQKLTREALQTKGVIE
ncbi:MAG: OXA-198 family carbapenem-hydrolyzing class D beta-lactamase [candidate division KSB1 bacterium]|nr:OXA-198 family carbapenem-hydrolyzing class D beta-lactamase [candidate division KSB1 bacterium]MDZ7276205.1 OXA-198 family carbapenem-hydrolyzing class D beta-lactamase [candidate division KSB1 bacterium]MDZ7287015.1 OXA-198 family carbapenem-hydrolyzing class D beta-lactamase [candidate division KSB1 bacterium]MDZ7297060.1 OXA-198 family carbapenem-hydrolyzing class D beta-lactamase [candidate division KSB1 bacterium]MDZ7307179.1 OXA-198 family carbapenem-hydrolyzing class D beta-lactamase